MKFTYLFIYAAAVTITLRVLIQDNLTYIGCSMLAGGIYGAIVGSSAKS